MQRMAILAAGLAAAAHGQVEFPALGSAVAVLGGSGGSETFDAVAGTYTSFIVTGTLVSFPGNDLTAADVRITQVFTLGTIAADFGDRRLFGAAFGQYFAPTAIDGDTITFAFDFNRAVTFAGGEDVRVSFNADPAVFGGEIDAEIRPISFVAIPAPGAGVAMGVAAMAATRRRR